MSYILKGEVASYTPATIDIDASNPCHLGAFFGAEAGPYSYKPELREFIEHLTGVALRSKNRHFVIEGLIVRAAQSRRLDALDYMSPGRVLVSIEV